MDRKKRLPRGESGSHERYMRDRRADELKEVRGLIQYGEDKLKEARDLVAKYKLNDKMPTEGWKYKHPRAATKEEFEAQNAGASYLRAYEAYDVAKDLAKGMDEDRFYKRIEPKLKEIRKESAKYSGAVWGGPTPDASYIRSYARQHTERKKESRLAASLAIIAFIGTGIFLFPNLTGNAIADLTTKTTSFLGVFLLGVGLVAGFFWVKSRKK